MKNKLCLYYGKPGYQVKKYKGKKTPPSYNVKKSKKFKYKYVQATQSNKLKKGKIYKIQINATENESRKPVWT